MQALFHVPGDVLKAHSPILRARPAVFATALASGMQESVSKTIVIEDCLSDTFKALLQLLYTDDLAGLEEKMVKQEGIPRVFQMLMLLDVSHKYEVTRLQQWCEIQLCQELTVPDVRSVLSKAHLLHAKQLEEVCVRYITEHLVEVVKQPAYTVLLKTCPQLIVKICLFAQACPRQRQQWWQQQLPRVSSAWIRQHVLWPQLLRLLKRRRRANP